MAKRYAREKKLSRAAAATVAWVAGLAAAIATAIVTSLSTEAAHSWRPFVWLVLGVVAAALVLTIPAWFMTRPLDKPKPPSRQEVPSGYLSFENIRWNYFRAQMMRTELYFIIYLVILAAAAYAGSYFPARSVFESLAQQKFGPSETAQVITAVGGLGVAIGTSIAAIIKAYALLLRARADVIRAKLQLPPGEQPTATENRELPGSG